jgi:phenylpropionate dioxygenase-like ring-hydroxylating dioxygenase large terminal subunit
MAPNYPFDPELYREVRSPLTEASTLPGWCYSDPAFYRREVETIFDKCWHFVGREDEMPEHGDYLTFDGVPGSVIVTRSGTGEIKAFRNACRHRGTQLLRGSGSARQIVCPYHSWVYTCDGKLLRAPGMDCVLDFDTRGYGLTSVTLSAWAGFLFIRYSTCGPTLMEWLGNMPDFFTDYVPADLRCVRRISFDVRANWKFLTENALETYHTGTVHRETLGRQQSEPAATEGEWSCLRVFVAGKQTLSVLNEDDSALPVSPHIPPDQTTSTFFTNIYPCTQFVFAPDSMWWLAVRPESADRSRLEVGSCFAADVIARPDFEEKVQTYFERWDTATPEDNAICEAQQTGSRTAPLAQGRFAKEEALVHALANWVLDQVMQVFPHSARP